MIFSGLSASIFSPRSVILNTPRRTRSRHPARWRYFAAQLTRFAETEPGADAHESRCCGLSIDCQLDCDVRYNRVACWSR